MDCPELNVAPVAESVSPRQSNEIIIAVPTISASTERKSVSSKRAAPIITFEEDNSSVINNNIWTSSTPPTTISLADACLKYQEKQRLAEEKSKPFATDSTYERLHAEPINVASSSHSNETEYIEEESPTAITIINPVIQTYASSFPSFSNSYDYKETDSSMSKATDSSSITSNTTPNPTTSQPSHSTSMSSSISSVHNSPDIPNPLQTTSTIENEYVSRIEELKITETEHIHRIQELEKRCANLEQRVTTLTL